MKLTFVPLLQLQRDLYRLPRGPERFRTYLRTMIDPEIDDVRLPLVAMNPMGKEHVPAVLDALLGFDADALAARCVAATEPDLSTIPGEYKVALVVSDDRMGAWTNRYASEFGHRFEGEAMYQRGWLVGILWTSDIPSEQTTLEEVRMTLHRMAYLRQHGSARTLRERMAQEGAVMAKAGCRQPSLDPDDLAYTREVIAPFLNTTDIRTAIECLYGDAASRTLGFTPRGLSDRAGLALALHEARQENANPSLGRRGEQARNGTRPVLVAAEGEEPFVRH